MAQDEREETTCLAIRRLLTFSRLSRSGKHDMNILKEAMMLLIANDASLPAEWRDHALNGKCAGFRECHVKGDLLLLYQVYDDKDGGLVYRSRHTLRSILA